MKRLSLLFIALSLRALTITQQPVVDQIGHAGMRFTWTVDTGSFEIWGWSLTDQSGDGRTDCHNYTGAGGPFSTNATHDGTSPMSMYVSGLLASTPYFFCMGAATGSGGTGTTVRATSMLVAGVSVGSVTTAALPSPHPALPVAPAQVSNIFPTIGNGLLSGNPPHVVSGSCDNASTGLVALTTSAAWGDTIQIPVNITCDGYYHITKSGWDGTHVMLIESQNISSLPPNVRVSPANAVNMPTIYENFWPHPGSPYGDQAHCYPGGFEWDDASNTPDPGTSNIFSYMHYCGNSGTTGTVSNVVFVSETSEAQATYTVTLSSPASITPTTGQWGYITGVGGIPKANGSFQVGSVSSSTSFQITTYNSYASPSGSTYTSGGTVQFFDYASVAFTPYTGAGPVGSCTDGTTGAAAWAYSTTDPGGSPLVGNKSPGVYNDPHYSTGRIWRCSGGVWAPHYIAYSVTGKFAVPTQSVFDISNAQHFWVAGLNFTSHPIFNDPLLFHSGQTITGGDGSPSPLQGGSAPGFTVVAASGFTNDVHFDRCIWTQAHPTKGDQFIQLDGTNLSITNSYLQNTGANWWGSEDRGEVYDNTAGPMIGASNCNTCLISNNYLEHYGITIHFDDQNAGLGIAGATSNITISRNTFFRNFALIYGAPGSTANYYIGLRQMLEFKSGVFLDINGNTFTNNFQNVSQGGAIALTPQFLGLSGGGGIYSSLSYSGSDGVFDTTPSGIGPTGYTVNVGDWVWLRDGPTPAQMFKVISSAPPVFHVANLTPALTGSFHIINLTGGDGISDVNVRNNTFTNVPTIFDNFSHGSHDQLPFRISQDRLAFTNNIMQQIGPGGTGTGILSLPYAERLNSSGCTGEVWTEWGGSVDTIFTNNTIYQWNPNLTPSACSGAGVGTIIAFNNNDFPLINILEGEGLYYQNNVEWTSAITDPVSANSQSSGGCVGNGNTILNCWQTGSVPYAVTFNCAYLPAGDPGGYSTPNFWGNFTGAPPQFVSPGTGNFTLLGTSGCKGQGTAGSDPGVNMAQLLAAQGVSNSGSIQSGATVQSGASVK